ncbi:M48 family metalloprotease [Tumidithrix elongata RA019]|uniref:M48 family metalloprotease n=1 Tax=Tumidithrix elongata BACA0141 TaxID=2716417 RepID=A0AAW9Q289_9CYAN|nr:M48 family metalloprotease [Tumidithrix elongata RA019]
MFCYYLLFPNKSNAYSFPGGKIFLSTGILNAIGTEAEFAGLLGHEVAHAVLSHGYSKMVDRLSVGAVGNVFGVGLIFDSQVAENTPTEEKQADILGTRAIASGGYSADGIWTVMRLLKAIQANEGKLSYLSSHPLSEDRLANLEEFINRNNFNRYGFEGVSSFREMQKRLVGEQLSETNPQIVPLDKEPLVPNSGNPSVATLFRLSVGESSPLRQNGTRSGCGQFRWCCCCR